MSNQFLPIVAPPAGNGTSASVDFSSFGGEKTITISGTWPGNLAPTIVIEMNNDPGQAGTWAPVCSFQGAGNKTVVVACWWLRATVSNYRGGSIPVIEVGGTDQGTSFATLVATAGDGAGASVDVAALPLFKTVQVGGAFRGACNVEISEDGGTTWSQAMSFSAGGQQSATFAADYMRVSRSGVPLVSPGLPIINVGATSSSGGGGGGAVTLTNITPPALAAGATADYTPTGLATADRVRQAVNVASSSLSGLGALPNGTVRYLENLGPAALTLTNEDTGSIATNRFTTPSGTPITVPPDGAALVVYDGPSLRWLATSIVKQTPYVNVCDYGADATGVADSRQAFVSAIAALTSGDELVIPSGTYVLSQAVAFTAVRQITIRGQGLPVIQYPSDDTLLSNTQRCAFVLSYTSDIRIDGVIFQGGTAQNVTVDNVGVGIYASGHSVNTIVTACKAMYGAGLFYQEQLDDSSGTGDTLTAISGSVTITDAAAPFNAGFVGRQITIAGATNNNNCGAYLITAFISATQVVFANPNGVTETSAFTWVVDNGDRITRLTNCYWYGCRGVANTANDGVFADCTFEQPMTQDLTGQGSSFTKVATTVTLTDVSKPFTPTVHGKYVRIASATSGGNNGLFRVTYINSQQISYTNAAGVVEAFAGTWWIMSGDKTGIGAGATGLVFAAGVVTLKASAASFTPDDVGKAIRIANATTQQNNGLFLISGYVSPTEVSFLNSVGASEAFAQGWALDAYDNVREAGVTYGSTHAIYIFAGRSNILVTGCTFKGIRTVCLKVSGSTKPIRNVAMRNCYAYECGALAALGADDAQQHDSLSVEACQAVNCATGRAGWSESVCVVVLGSRNTMIARNQFQYTRNAIRAVDGTASLAGVYAIQGVRYVPGRSQPIQDLTIMGNKIVADPTTTTPVNLMNTVFWTEAIGTAEIYGNDGSLTKSGTTMTLTSTIGLFSQEYVGSSFALFGSAGGNDISGVTVTSVATNGQSLTYENAGGADGFGSGYFRIGAPRNKPGGQCNIVGNEVSFVAPNGVLSKICTGPNVDGNTFDGVEVLAQFVGDVTPRFANNRQIGRVSDTAGVRFNNNDAAADTQCVSWPYVDGNLITSTKLGNHDWGIGIGVSSGVYVDFPLLGKRGRSLPSDGKEEVVVSYGDQLVAGDTITVDDGVNPAVTYTYYPAPFTGTQFNSFASLIALIAAQPGIDCTDYGDGFEDSAGTPQTITTLHMRIRAAAATANTDGTLKVTVDALCKTALVLLPNTISPNLICGGRGSGSAGPTADKTVIWSPFCAFEGCETLVADNADAQTLLVSDGFRSIRQVDGQDGGSNCRMQLGTTVGTEQFRWVIA